MKTHESLPIRHHILLKNPESRIVTLSPSLLGRDCRPYDRVYPLVTGVFLTNSVFACGHEIRAKVETYSYVRLTRSRKSDDLSLTQGILITKSCMT